MLKDFKSKFYILNKFLFLTNDLQIAVFANEKLLKKIILILHL